MESSLEAETQASIKARRKEKWRQTSSQIIFGGLFAASLIVPNKLIAKDSIVAKPLSVVLPIVILTAWAWALAAYVRNLEEFERSLAVNSFAITFGTLLWGLTCYGILALSLDLPSFPVALLAPLAVVLWQISWEILKKRYL